MEIKLWAVAKILKEKMRIDFEIVRCLQQGEVLDDMSPKAGRF